MSDNGLFPDRNDALQLVDKPLAGGKCFLTMRRENFHPNRRLVNLYHANPVDEPHGLDRPAFSQLIEEEIELMLGHALESFVFEAANGGVALNSPDHSRKADRRPASAGSFSLRQKSSLINRLSRYQQVPLHILQPAAASSRA